MIVEALAEMRAPGDGRGDRLILAAAALVCLGALFARSSSSLLTPTFYAEDGRDFFAQAYNAGWPSIIATVNGYFHLYPRLLANLALSMGVPLAAIPGLFVAGCLGIYCCLWGAIAVRIPRSVGVRSLLILATVLVPVGNEIFVNQTNIQWFMPPLAVILWSGDAPGSALGRAMRAMLFVLSLWTGPFAIVLAPIFLMDAIRAGDWRQRGALLGVASAAALSTLATLVRFGTVERLSGGVNVSAYGFLQLLVRTFLYPLFSLGVDDLSGWPVVVLSVLVLVGLVWLGRAAARGGERFAVLSFVSAMAFFATTIASYWRDPSLLSPYTSASRVFYLPMVFLLWSLISVTRFDRMRVVAWSVAVLWSLVQIPLITWQPLSWERDPATLWPTYARRLEAGESLRVPIRPPGWEMVLDPRS